MQLDDAVTPVTPDDARRLALELFGLEASVQALPGEYDHNFRLDAGGGRAFVLKVMHPARDPDLIDLQCAALRHAERRAPRLALPRVQATLSGAALAPVPAVEGTRLAWLLTWLEGGALAHARPREGALLRDLGRFLGELDTALEGFAHPAARRELKWDLTRAGWIRAHLDVLAEPARRALVERALERFEADVAPRLHRLRRGVIHGDANDHNVIVSGAHERPRRAAGLIDFGDMHHGLIVAEPAVAAAYAVFDQVDVLAAAAHVVAGYHGAHPLEDDELAALPALVGARLAVSVVNSALRRSAQPDDAYVTVSEAPAWEALARWTAVHARFATAALRDACGLTPLPQATRVVDWLRAHTASAAPVLGVDLRREPCLVFDLSVGSRLLGADPRAAETEALTTTVFDAMRRAGVSVGVGRYDEARAFYTSELFAGSESDAGERRTIHLGLDLFAPPGTPVAAPLDGVVHRLANNAARGDYGPLVILRHAAGDGTPFFTLYGHLSEDTLAALRVGQTVARGERFARVGAPPTNGDWAPHLHLQIILDLLELDGDFPGVAQAARRRVWSAFSPDPNLLVGIPAERFPPPEPAPEALRAARVARLGRNLSLSYERPLHIVRGFGSYLFDHEARAYLDVYNNVPLVGHTHPRVVRAVQEQIALLNTNTRYLHDNVLRYAERLTARLPEPLRVCYLVSSGSEANELALRLARAHTRREDVIVLEHAYHGHTTTLIDVSPYKFDGPGGSGRRGWVHVAPLPDDYRGSHRRDDPHAGAKYARRVAEIITALVAQGRGLAAYLAETLPSVAGQIVFPRGYLTAAYAHVRAAGGLCIADEVQTGFGRLGTHFWGFEMHGAQPDIVVLGKPIGNAFPLAAVVTTHEVAASFDNGMEFFATFGGNPVACAAGLAVLDVLDAERLQDNARDVGAHLMGGLRALQARHPLIGDVRGAGLFLGIELVRDPLTLEPAAREAAYVVNRLRERGILTGTDGPHHNVLKLRPPLCFTRAQAERFVAALDDVLAEDAAKPCA